MKVKICSLVCLILMIYGCAKEPLDISEFDHSIIKDNVVELRPNTKILDDEMFSSIITKDSNSIVFDTSIEGELSAGDVLMSNFNTEVDGTGFIYKITQVSGNKVRIERGTLQDAYASYTFDSRSDNTILQPRSFFSQALTFKEEYKGFDIEGSGSFTPDITGGWTWDDFIFTAEYDEALGIASKFRLEVQNLRLEMSASFMANFKLETKKEFAPEQPILIGTIPETPLAVYFLPKLEVSGSIEGTVASPVISQDIGGYTMWMDYDQSRIGSEMIDTIFSAQQNVNSPENDAWSFSGTGGLGAKMGGEVFIALPGLDDFAKAGIFGYIYGSANGKGVSTFAVPEPGIEISAESGLGCQFSAELNFFAGADAPSPISWFPSGVKIESPEFTYPYKTWNLGKISTCNNFDVSVINYANGAVTVNVGNSDPQRTSYDIYINGKQENTTPFSYNQDENLVLGSTGQILTEVKIVDTDNSGCFILDYIPDPSLIGACVTKFTDTRDNNEYCQVTIGSQIWMGENLRYTDFGRLGVWYNNKEGVENQLYGRLYTQPEVLNGEQENIFAANPSGYRKTQGICPQGWRIPDENDFTILDQNLSNSQWKYPSNVLWPNLGTLDGIFNAVPSGEYYPWNAEGDKFGHQGVKTSFWTNTVQERIDGYKAAFIVSVDDRTNFVGVARSSQSIKQIGYSCRCIKD